MGKTNRNWLARSVKLGLFLAILMSACPAVGYQIVSEGEKPATCDEVWLHKELKIYKDPTIFMGDLALIQQDPAIGWENLMRQNPLLTTVRGTVHLMQLGPAREFKHFGAIARLYEVADPKFRQEKKLTADGRSLKKQGSLIVPIMLCGDNDAYKNSLGFVLQEDFQLAQVDELEREQMPPSTYPNPIPKLKKDRDKEVPQSQHSSLFP